MIAKPKNIKKFNNFNPPFSQLTTNVCLALIDGKSMSGKSYCLLGILNTIKKEILNNCGCFVMGADTQKSDVYLELKKFFTDRIRFIPDYSDTIFNEFEEQIETKPFKDFEYNILIIDDVVGVCTPKLKKQLAKCITTYRHYNIFVIAQIQTIKSDMLPKVLRTNTNIIAVSNKAMNDLEELKKICLNSGINTTRFETALSESRKHNYSFLVWCAANDYLVVFSDNGWA